MEKEFEQYIQNTRNEFVVAVNELQWNTGFRTKCENLLIAYDQMKQELRKQAEQSRKQSVTYISEQLIDFAIKSGYIENMPRGNKDGLIDRFEKSINYR